MTTPTIAASAASAIHGPASATAIAVQGAAAVVAPAPAGFENGSLRFELVKRAPTTIVAGFVACPP